MDSYWMQMGIRVWHMHACWVIVCGLLFSAVGYAADQDGLVQLKGTPLSYAPPLGMQEDTANIYMSPDRPFRSYQLVNPSPHGDGQDFEILIEPVIEDVPSLQFALHDVHAYARSRTCGQDILLKPKSFSIDGHEGLEFAVVDTGVSGGAYIADTTEGAKTGLLPDTEFKSIRFEVVFSVDGKLFHCVMTDEPDRYKQHLAAFERFCKSVKITASN